MSKNNYPDLEQEIKSCEFICNKIKNDHNYATNFYRALCNTEWYKLEVESILKGQYWCCSWRYAGGIISDIQNSGDYLDWYCSGDEGYIDPEIAQDLKKIGWIGKSYLVDCS